MASTPSNDAVTFTTGTRAEFLQHLRENPNNRRISQDDKATIIQWLTNPHKRPSSQEEFSRRNYVRKTFVWDEENRNLRAVAKEDKGKDRAVVLTDMIADVVESVHEDNSHAGWDATWKDVSTLYYGILRSDVIFLLKQCQTCSRNPSKRPKGSAIAELNFQPTADVFVDFLNTNDDQHDKPTSDAGENKNHRYI